MRLLRGIGMAVLAVGVALAGAAMATAQSSQQNTQQQDGNTGTTPTPANNLPYNPPAPPPGGYGDASTGSYSGRGTSGYGSGQSNGSGSGGGYGTGQSGNSSGLGHIGANSPIADDTPQTPQQIEIEQARARNAERQQQLVADTQKLVSLANELQDEVSKSTKDMLSLDVVRKADEIEKLARTVRDRMKNAN